MRKTLITGVGMITSLGSNVETTWNSLVEGKCGIRRISKFDASNLETQIAAEVDNCFEEQAAKVISKRHRRQMTRSTRMLVTAAEEAITDSNIDFENFDKTRIGIFLGIVSTGYDEFEKQESNSHAIVKSMANAPAAWISIMHGLEGPAFSMATACASSAYAISIAHNMIRSGVIDIAIVGGGDSHIDPEYISGFNQILAMSTKNDMPEKASAPFSKTRDGFVMGEGAGVMVLEAEEIALKRNARILAELAGTAITSEAGDITAPKAEGEGMAKTMRLALKDAGIAYNDVDYVNAHGTSTYLNDKYETKAIKECFGDRAYKLVVSSSKSMIGHTIGAAGSIEGIICVKTIGSGIVTPTINYIKDDELDLNYVPDKYVEKDINVAVSNSFGFGGHNATLVFKRY